MAKYLVLIYGDEQRWATRTPEEQQALTDGHATFSATAGAGVIGGHELADSATATSLRAGTDGPTITDGPFLETKEALGGFYLIEAADLDEAIRWSSLLPEVADDHSGVEIRPIGEHS
ncbi:MAG: YciI family protein [Lapillicoccus sp.]